MTIQKVKLELIDDNPYQPRSSYSTNKIDELAHSIGQIGLRQIPESRQVDGRYQLAFGHMRKRAFAKLIKRGTKSAYPDIVEHIKNGTMPLDVKPLTDKQMVEFAIEENIRRADITPMDVARTIELYLQNFKDETITSAGVKFNLTQGAVSNMLRVLKCPQEVLEKIDNGKINFTMARELLVFQGKRAKGEHESWGGGKQKKVPKDETYLMREAIKKIGGTYGPSATVDGIKKAIFEVARENFPALEKAGSSWYRNNEPLFDTRAAGCLKCEHSITCYETKTQARHYCTNPECWEKKQEAHKRKQAAKAKKLADEEVRKQVAEMEQARISAAAAPPETISQEIPEAPVPADAEITTEVPSCQMFSKPEEEQPPDAETTGAPEETETAPEPEPATEPEAPEKPAAPASVKAAAKDQVGTRAQILDLRDLRAGSYGDLKHGYVLLNSGFQAPLENMEAPEECTERCTKGFHYAYDSSRTDGSVLFVCSDPKCVSKKKAAFTRAKNADGQAKKKAEMAAIREAVDKTTEIDKPRMLLILEAEMLGRHVRSYSYSRSDTKEVLMKIIGIQKSDQYEHEEDTVKKIRTALIGKSDTELAKIIVEYMLRMFLYDGDIKEYKVNTTGYLNLMKVGVNVEKKEVTEASAGKFPDGG